VRRLGWRKTRRYGGADVLGSRYLAVGTLYPVVGTYNGHTGGAVLGTYSGRTGGAAAAGAARRGGSPGGGAARAGAASGAGSPRPG
jgi:hypothetical protein